jgi:hypothetical protein
MSSVSTHIAKSTGRTDRRRVRIGEPNVTVALRVPESYLAQIDSRADTKGVTRSEVVREMCRVFFARDINLSDISDSQVGE